MKFHGTTRSALAESRQAWDAWLRAVGANSDQARFARRLVELIEARIGSPQPHVATVAPQAIREAMGQLRAPLTICQVGEVILALLDCWKYGMSLRNWAIRRGYLTQNGDVAVEEP